MDNQAIARVFAEIADLLEIKGENAFKIRAYRTASDTIAAWADGVSRLDEKQLLELPGIGKDLAKKIRELADSGTCRFHQDLLLEFPPTILDLLRLQGVGPKTVALLYSALNIRTLDDLAAAAREGRLRELRGMGTKKEALILKALDERQKDAGRHLLSDSISIAAELTGYLRERAPDVEFVPVGSLRRGCETCGDIDILAVGPDVASERAAALMSAFLESPRVERVLGHGDTKSSIRLSGGYQADLRLVPAESRGAAMQYFTGSKAHNIVLRDRAIQRDLKLNEYGLFRVSDDGRVAGDTEEGIYEALGLQYIEPELREQRGEIEAALDGRLPRLVALTDLRGDLHMHTTVTDGRDDLVTMAEAAQRAGHEYIAITDHSRALAMANGLDEHRALEHAARIRDLNGRFEGLTLLAGIECDILPDGRLDLADDCLAQLDLVVASIHSHFSMDESQMTDRVLHALECPWVDVLGHPTGRLLLKREGYRLNIEQVVAAAARAGVAMEINCQVDRLDLNDAQARLAREREVRLVISTDAHSALALGNLRWGIRMARRAWASPDDVLNARSLEELRPLLRRNRNR
ncbi:MAG TPA: DNA polymerase/3'-5' exonuclease PolX [Vicinamibacterales bacterium]|nr:DNA polymerase/3'-5' exonuclease PolX [Vicinamibacterales bacterium]